MSTPFDDITWTIQNTWHDHSHTRPILDDQTNTAIGLRAVMNTHSELDSRALSTSGIVQPSIFNEHHEPLRCYTRFKIIIADKEPVKIEFTDTNFGNMKKIWDSAQNVYYDREFYAVRGELMYNKQTGEASSSFGRHFVISYDGRMATGGIRRMLSINLYGEQDIATPTFRLLHLQYVGTPSLKGSWKADS